jgi:hypothetical protein
MTWRAALIRQRRVCAVLLAAGLAAALAGSGPALELALAAGTLTVLYASLGAAASRVEARRAVDAIIKGRERMPVAAVQCQRRRLLAPRTQTRLSGTLDELLSEALAGGSRARSARPGADPHVIGQVANELRIVIADLRTGTQSARAVALAERLITEGDSVLYGDDPTALRDTLDRIVFLTASPPG